MATRRTKVLTAAVALIGLAPVLLLMVLVGLSWRRPVLGLQNGHLLPCPDTPNCVSSRAEDSEHRMSAWKFHSSPEESLQQIRALIAAQPRARIVTERPDYLHVEFTSRFFRFVDDVEFHIDRDAGVVDFRSASRVGRSDLGVNRSRMEALGEAYRTLER